MSDDKAIFMANYVANLCAVWQATNYERNCTEGCPERTENPPLEDFCYLADEMWEKFQKLKDKYPPVKPHASL